MRKEREGVTLLSELRFRRFSYSWVDSDKIFVLMRNLGRVGDAAADDDGAIDGRGTDGIH